MHILITDSGVGGLSVCAYAERFLRTRGVGEPVRLTYVNASPENNFGYNSMSSRSEKLEHFDRFLRIISGAYSPDSIYIACNSLSVLYPHTEYSRCEGTSVKGIVDTGIGLLLQELKKSDQSIVAIFGTDTTIQEQTYLRLLRNNGIEECRIISQACPSLADTISEDRQGFEVQKKVEQYVGSAFSQSKIKTTDYLVYLACTHYGYRKDLFAAAFKKRGIDPLVLNPNEFVIEDLLSCCDISVTKKNINTEISVEFVSRYIVPETALETIAYFLDEISPKTVRAFSNYTHAPDLF